MKRIKTFVLGVVASLVACVGYAVETPITLVSYTPDVVVIPRDEAIVIENEAVMFSPPSPDELEARAGELELLVFTADKPGKCPACDRARPLILGLAKLYPITPVYCSLSAVPRCKGDLIAREYGVREYPTCVLVERQADGDAIEIVRWSGVGSFARPIDKRIADEFKRAGFVKPRKPPIPPREPRPIPGLRREPPKPPKRGADVPPGRRPGAPRIGFEIDLSDLPEFAE